MTDQKGLPMDTTPISEAIREMIRIEVELGTMPKTLGPGVYAYREQLLLQWSAHETVLREGLQAIADDCATAIRALTGEKP